MGRFVFCCGFCRADFVFKNVPCLQMLYYSRCVGVTLDGRVAGKPLISCFTSRVLKELDKVDQDRRNESRSWEVLTGKEKVSLNGVAVLF